MHITTHYVHVGNSQRHLKFGILIYILYLFYTLSKAERRILDGKQLTINRRYVVYMIKASDSILYDAWLCGGAIVSPWYILTSAACVEDVKHMYAIAGYKKYVPYADIDTNSCTKRMKRKIVFVCLHTDYNFDYPRVERWANVDIALVKVEKPYNFSDIQYEKHCSYIPNKIEINYDVKLQEPGTDAIVFGWGHTERWRSVEDIRDYNQDNLLYGAVKLARKEDCKKEFVDAKFRDIIEKYMICSMYEGDLDDGGDVIDNKNKPEIYLKECGPGALRVGDKCVQDPYYNANTTYDYTRRRGICQNDHGGPIVTWRGPKELLIGIASVFKVEDSTKKCVPPFLYTSTRCNGDFIHCLMNSAEDGEMSIKETLRCDKLAKDKGFNIIRRTISWVGHPDGPAYNEIHASARNMGQKSDNSNVQMRPQIRLVHNRS